VGKAKGAAPAGGPAAARGAIAAALGLAAAFLAVALSASRHSSLTWDEPSFLSAGYAYLTRGEFRFNPSHPPLAQDLVAAPLLALDLHVPRQPFEFWAGTGNAVVAFGRELVFGSGNDPLRIAASARWPVLLVGAALVFGVWAVGRRKFGDGAALVGAAVAAFSPDLLAHSGLATEDLVCAAMMFAAVATFDRAVHRRRRRDWVRCGVVTGLALSAKYTSLLLGPAYLLIFAWERRLGRRAAAVRDGAVGFGWIALVAALVVGASYNFTFDYAAYVRGFRSLYGDLAATYHHYLLGAISTSPFPHYHVVAFLLKTPLPILALIGWGLARGLADARRRDVVVPLLVPAVIVFTASFFDRANFGVRRVLPAYPFLFTIASASVAGKSGRLARGAALALLAWCAVETARIHPHELSYFHELAGGPARGPYLLEDSNLDWGQDLPALAAWQRTHPEAQPLRLSYFGTAEPGAYGVHAIAMQRDEIARPQPGWYAVSAHRLVWFRKLALLGDDATDWLTAYEPVDRAGWSIWIYRFD
jgi:hypothetical protein